MSSAPGVQSFESGGADARDRAGQDEGNKVRPLGVETQPGPAYTNDDERPAKDTHNRLLLLEPTHRIHVGRLEGLLVFRMPAVNRRTQSNNDIPRRSPFHCAPKLLLPFPNSLLTSACHDRIGLSVSPSFASLIRFKAISQRMSPASGPKVRYPAIAAAANARR